MSGNDLNVKTVAINGSKICAVTSDIYSHVFLSANYGSSWTATNNGLNGSGVSSFAISGNNIFAGTSIGVSLLTNGNYWVDKSVGLPGAVVTLAISGGNIFAGTNDGVYVSTNNGNNWIASNSGLSGSAYTSHCNKWK